MLEALCVLLLTGCITAAEPAEAPETETPTAQVAAAAEQPPAAPARERRDAELR